jgi:hypothetical protein
MGRLDEAVALAGVDPRALHAQLSAGQPDRTVQLARAFEDAGREARDAYQRGRRAHGMIADGFANDGAPVLDAAARVVAPVLAAAALLTLAGAIVAIPFLLVRRIRSLRSHPAVRARESVSALATDA